MSKSVRRPIGILVILIAILGAMRMLRRDDVPGWVYPALLVAAAVCMVVFAVRAARTPGHDRFAHDQQWATILSAEEALQRVADHWGSLGARVTRRDQQVQVEIGSDIKLRFLGVHTRRGRRSFPSVLTVTATATEEGMQLRAHSRDNLGWYPLMHSAMPQLAAQRNEHLVETCRRLTFSPQGEMPVEPQHGDEQPGIGTGSAT